VAGESATVIIDDEDIRSSPLPRDDDDRQDQHQPTSTSSSTLKVFMGSDTLRRKVAMSPLQQTEGEIQRPLIRLEKSITVG